MLVVVIICGGNGTRLWPLSRETAPKQFLKLTDPEYTMFQLTCQRASQLSPDKYLVICNQQHAELANQQLRKVGITNFQIIGEPFGKNTAGAVATACQLLSESDSVLVMSSDHVFDDQAFKKTIEKGLQLIDQGIVVFGIKPTYAETGYGYVHFENDNLIQFKEKPTKKVAEEYLINGKYLWNSGNFLFKNQIMIQEFKKHANDIWESIALTLQNSQPIENQVIVLNRQYFDKVRDDSVDYAIMEHHQNGKVVQYDNYWNDIGSFYSLYQHFKESGCQDNNVFQGQILQIDTKDSMVISQNPKKLVALIGINDLIVVDTEDALFICVKERSQEIKKLLKKNST